MQEWILIPGPQVEPAKKKISTKQQKRGDIKGTDTDIGIKVSMCSILLFLHLYFILGHWAAVSHFDMKWLLEWKAMKWSLSSDIDYRLGNAVFFAVDALNAFRRP